MIFSSTIFLFVFLPTVFILNFLVKKKYSNVLLLVASLIFYAWGEPVLVLLMIASIVINWLVGRFIEKLTGNKKKIVLVAGIVCDIGILGYYKYIGFIVKTINTITHLDIISVPDIVMPIGISFFTFQSISYIIDVYKGEAEVSRRLVNTALYISFFPQLVAGPIVKYRDINKQIESRNITFSDVSIGFKRFVYGLGKKVLISNIWGGVLILYIHWIFLYLTGRQLGLVH